MRAYHTALAICFLGVLLGSCQTKKDQPVNMRCGTNQVVTPDGCVTRADETLLPTDDQNSVDIESASTADATADDGVTPRSNMRHIADDYRSLHRACEKITGAQPESDACLCPDGGRLAYSHYVDELDRFRDQCQRVDD